MSIWIIIYIVIFLTNHIFSLIETGKEMIIIRLFGIANKNE